MALFKSFPHRQGHPIPTLNSGKNGIDAEWRTPSQRLHTHTYLRNSLQWPIQDFQATGASVQLRRKRIMYRTHSRHSYKPSNSSTSKFLECFSASIYVLSMEFEKRYRDFKIFAKASTKNATTKPRPKQISITLQDRYPLNKTCEQNVERKVLLATRDSLSISSGSLTNARKERDSNPCDFLQIPSQQPRSPQTPNPGGYGTAVVQELLRHSSHDND